MKERLKKFMSDHDREISGVIHIASSIVILGLCKKVWDHQVVGVSAMHTDDTCYVRIKHQNGFTDNWSGPAHKA